VTGGTRKLQGAQATPQEQGRSTLLHQLAEILLHGQKVESEIASFQRYDIP